MLYETAVYTFRINGEIVGHRPEKSSDAPRRLTMADLRKAHSWAAAKEGRSVSVTLDANMGITFNFHGMRDEIAHLSQWNGGVYRS